MPKPPRDTPQLDPAPARGADDGTQQLQRTWEAWAADLGTPDWLARATAAGQQWGQGQLMDQGTFTAAVQQAATAPNR